MGESLDSLKRTSMCGELNITHVGHQVVLMGWVHKRRDHGGLIFIDLRDRTGLTQIVFSPEVNKEAYNKAEKVRGEYVLAVAGKVQKRPQGTVNENLKTGEIEVYITEIRVLSEAKTPPFTLTEAEGVEEPVRLKYRYIDLRRPEMQRVLFLRHRISKSIRDFLDGEGFWEIETPMLTRSTPEGARDFLVPSRLHAGDFYALPQSPQIFKQILMVAGMDKYFQIVRCFRDEDLRADRQPEFTQLDMEMSFVDEEDIIDLVERLVSHMFLETLGLNLTIPFPRISYDEAMDRYGSDRPDVRFGLELVDITPIAAKTKFKVFSKVVSQGGKVKGINAKGCGDYSRKEIDNLTAFVEKFGAKGLAWMVVTSDGVKSPIAKFFSEDEISAIGKEMDAKPGDLLFFIADKPSIVAESLGNLRLELARQMNLINEEQLSFTWVTDFPLVKYDDEEKRWDPNHHPFTSPNEGDLELLDSDPGGVKAQAYDLILNGIEIGGGSIRIHDRDIQERVFALIGLEDKEIKEKFGFMLEAFEYGVPPHGGIAFGLDRLVMIMAGKESIRDCIAFPKTQSATCLMTEAPSEVSKKQLQELGIRALKINK
jgi:aspartyl-tRNA synthetase